MIAYTEHVRAASILSEKIEKKKLKNRKKTVMEPKKKTRQKEVAENKTIYIWGKTETNEIKFEDTAETRYEKNKKQPVYLLLHIHILAFIYTKSVLYRQYMCVFLLLFMYVNGYPLQS